MRVGESERFWTRKLGVRAYNQCCAFGRVDRKAKFFAEEIKLKKKGLKGLWVFRAD
jgi:hypothetical protein